jgi:hypothetical protein
LVSRASHTFTIAHQRTPHPLSDYQLTTAKLTYGRERGNNVAQIAGMKKHTHF